jgi:hypothetical protein
MTVATAAAAAAAACRAPSRRASLEQARSELVAARMVDDLTRRSRPLSAARRSDMNDRYLAHADQAVLAARADLVTLEAIRPGRGDRALNRWGS